MKAKNYFKGKRITVMGLGLLGRAIGDTEFLAKNGADLIVTDLKSKKELKISLDRLKKYKNIKYTLGKHRLQDFRNRDMILKTAGVSLNSPYIKEAKKNKIPIEMSASLFVKISQLGSLRIQVIGVTGTRGKSTVTQMIYEILKVVAGEKQRKQKKAFCCNKSDKGLSFAGHRIFLGGNIKGVSTLSLLSQVRKDDTVVMELDSWQLQGFGDSKISPNIAIFTTFLLDHLNYYKGDMNKYLADKSNIYRWQKENDLIIVGQKAAKFIKEKNKNSAKGRFVIANQKNIPHNWKIKLLGTHNLQNISLAIETARILDIKEAIIKKVAESFNGLPGRLEFIREVSGVKYYNDTTATTPDATIAALNSFKNKKGKIILIGGGADKNLEYGEYAKIVKKYVKDLILFKGYASDKIISAIGKVKFLVKVFDNMKSAIKFTTANAQKGDIILLSPGAASFGVFKNEFDRGEQFNKIVKNLKKQKQYTLKEIIKGITPKNKHKVIFDGQDVGKEKTIW